MCLDDTLTAVGVKQEPHESHKMTEWVSTVCVLSNNDRFGRKRKCEKCNGEDYLCGGPGSRWQSKELSKPCK